MTLQEKWRKEVTEALGDDASEVDNARAATAIAQVMYGNRMADGA